MSSSSTDLAHANSNQIFAFDNIINKNLITELLKNISEAQECIKTKSEEDNNINTSTNTTNTNNEGENNETRTCPAICGNSSKNTTKADTTGNNGGSINCFCCKNTTTTTTDTKAVINTGANTTNNGGTPKSRTFKNPNENQNNKSKNLSLHLNGKLENLRIDLDYVQKSFNHLREYEDHVVNPFETVSHSVNSIVTEIKADPSDSLLKNRDFQTRLRELEKNVMNLKVHIPSAHKMYSSAISEAQHFTASVHGSNAPKTMMDGLPVLSMSENFQSSSAYNDFQEVYNTLDFNLKLCLLCFSVFPEKAVVKRRILMYWWIGEGLIVPRPERTVEEVADDILVQLAKKGLIQAVNKQHRSVADSFSMHPLIRSAVIMRAKKVEFFDFDHQGNPAANFVLSRRACLFGKGSSFQLSSEKKEESDDAESKGKKQEEEGNKAESTSKKRGEEKRNEAESKRKKQEEKKNAQLKHEKLYTLYNVNEEYLKFEPEWFLKLKNVHVLQVGRWMSSAENHIEVEDIEFLKRLKNMKLLMYFSLQGISRISELPDTIGSLTNLRILDLRACHNLEILPEEIGALQNLTHLDMSECYLLDNMPHGIASLVQLEVLKGFVIGDRKTKTRCTLTDLKRLTKLRKLTISTSLKAFPTSVDLKALYMFGALRKLKIAWGGSSDLEVAKPSIKKFQNSNTLKRFAATLRPDNTTIPETAALPTALEKLDLQCFPHTNTPSWLNPSHLTKLKKLYIRGGNLSDLPDNEMDHKWEVTILRLKYLYELVIDWTELRASFPKLTYLEMVKCPKLTFCPCDDAGVWRKC